MLDCSFAPARTSLEPCGPSRPPSVPWFGNASGVVLPMSGITRPFRPHWMPTARAKSRVVWTIRASTSTCGSARSMVDSSALTASSLAGRSVMISVLVRSSTCTSPRADSTARLTSGAAAEARA